jgi:hypothetical protein
VEQQIWLLLMMAQDVLRRVSEYILLCLYVFVGTFLFLNFVCTFSFLCFCLYVLYAFVCSFFYVGFCLYVFVGMFLVLI